VKPWERHALLKPEETVLKLKVLIAASGLLMCMGALPLWAQGFPAKPLRLILPFPPGGPTDLLGRTLGQKMAENMGQAVVIDNRPGAGGNLGVELAAKSPPDGYTMVLSSPLISISPSLYAKLNYDPVKDLAPISLAAAIQNVMIVHPSVPSRSLKEFIAMATANPGKFNFGSGGTGTTSHLAPELLMSLTKIKMVHVPFKGTGVGMIGLMSGQVDTLFIAAPIAAPQVNAGKVRALAVLAEKRTAALPNVPTSKEAGLNDFVVPLWYGILTSAGTARDNIAKLNTEVARALGAKDLMDKFASAGIDPMPSSPEQFAAFIRSETVRYAKVIRDAGIKPE
jgi:tripartite-type tricarboxylate transporter receptor subunit TctC